MPIVRVAEGQLKGTEETLPSGGKYYSFKGIPYARPPIGELRFKDPELPLPWDGVRDASKHGPICPQLNPMMPPGEVTDEDCLYLNVYTRSINLHSKTPVMLWIHGGGFVMGSGNEQSNGPDYIIDKNVVLVTINYRLEAFGFLCLDNPEVPGNAGMKDQTAAMKWVKQNIENFGGDPDDVTIFGVSAGGTSVALQLVSPLARGLFTKVIIQSGSSIADWSHMSHGRDLAFQLGKYLGKETNNDEELLTFLRGVPASDLVNITSKFKEADPLLQLAFLPVIEKHFQGVPAFLEKDPIEYIVSREVPDVPVVVGVTSGEGILFVRDDLSKADMLNEQPDFCVFRELRKNRSPEEINELSKEIKKFYLGDERIGVETIRGLVDLKSDYAFTYPAHRLASLLAQYNSNPVYFYYYTFVDDTNMMNAFMKGEYADKLPLATHGAELNTLFKIHISPPVDDPNSPVAVTIKNMSTLWTNFAKTGTPTPDKKLGVKWERFSTELKNYLQVDVPLSMGRNCLADRMKMWNDLFKKDGLPF